MGNISRTEVKSSNRYFQKHRFSQKCEEVEVLHYRERLAGQPSTRVQSFGVLLFGEWLAGRVQLLFERTGSFLEGRRVIVFQFMASCCVLGFFSVEVLALPENEIIDSIFFLE